MQSSSVQSSLASTAIQIGHHHTPSQSRNHSLSSTPYMTQSRRSYINSPAMSQSRSSVDLRNASSQRFYASHQLGGQSIMNSRYMCPYLPSSSNASPSYMGSSSRQPYLLHCNESASSLSPFASAQSLPGC
ncbi:RING-type E3 ubiquitin transferase [Ranunculus cassubicifolius]